MGSQKFKTWFTNEIPRQPELILEDNLVAQLQTLGYVNIPGYDVQNNPEKSGRKNHA